MQSAIYVGIVFTSGIVRTADSQCCSQVSYGCLQHYRDLAIHVLVLWVNETRL